jgi:hypothetical protein
MIIFRVILPYESNSIVQSLTVEVYQELRAKFDDWDIPEEPEKFSYYNIGEVIADVNEIDYLTKLGIKPLISKVKGLNYPRDLEQRASNSTNITNVSVPNHNLYMTKKVTNLNDACTDELQSMLDKGWRILAVCPSNDSRRPDYILGHEDKEI